MTNRTRHVASAIALVLLAASVAWADTPLTTRRLCELAAARGIGAGQTGVLRNRSIGRSFQDAALAAIGETENHRPFLSDERRLRTSLLAQPRRSVVPDVVRTILDATIGQRPLPPLPDSSFVEVKAVRGTLHLSSSNWQIAGLIDALSRSPAGESTYARPVLVFVTTSDTIISASVIAFAQKRDVLLWQKIAVEKEGGRIAFGPAVPLGVKLTTVTEVPRGGLLGTTPAVELRNGLKPSTNPDPTEVEP